MRTYRNAHREPDALVLAAATWLAAGVVLLGLTPLPLHDAHYGWSLAFWLLAAPSAILAARSFVRTPARESHCPPARFSRKAFATHAAAPMRLRSIRRRNSCMMRR